MQDAVTTWVWTAAVDVTLTGVFALSIPSWATVNVTM